MKLFLPSDTSRTDEILWDKAHLPKTNKAFHYIPFNNVFLEKIDGNAVKNCFRSDKLCNGMLFFENDVNPTFLNSLIHVLFW